MSLRLTFLLLPGVVGMEFLSPPEWRKDVGISVHLSEVPLVPINLSSTPREGVSARPAHAASYRIACGAKKKKTCAKREVGMSLLTFTAAEIILALLYR